MPRGPISTGLFLALRRASHETTKLVADIGEARGNQNYEQDEADDDPFL